MATKNDLYIAITRGELSSQQWEQFFREHPSVQHKTVGKGIMQVRCRDTETWMSLKDWASNYHNSMLKRLNDLVLASQDVLQPQEIFEKLVSTDVRRSWFNDVVRKNIANGNLAHGSDLREMTADRDKFAKQAESQARHIQVLKDEVQRLNSLLDSIEAANHGLRASRDVAEVLANR